GLGLMAARPGDGLAPVAFGLIAMVAAGIAQEFARGIRARQRVSRELPWVALAGLFRTSRRRYGGYLVHLAVVLMALGIVGEGLYGSEHEATLKRGEAVAVGRYQVRFEALSSEMLATRDRHVATVGVYVGDQRVMTLRPEYNYHHSVRSYVAEVALRSTLREDLYVAIVGIAEDASAVSFRVLLNPLMLWLWIGGGLLLFGTLVALWPEGSRVALVTLEAQRRRA
ncbi:MAG: cytochrome c-type biogenesis CcmF C-terminal domain-containing protein, partial [Anaerolineae bacterium]|nr:cytochrome c-type biogenesis CcmF C-terminal domain-containing protein [Anaerolineae bacterium]